MRAVGRFGVMRGTGLPCGRIVAYYAWPVQAVLWVDLTVLCRDEARNDERWAA